MKVKAFKAWAILSKSGHIEPSGVEPTRKKARSLLELFDGESIIPVLITPIVKRKKSKKGK